MSMNEIEKMLSEVSDQARDSSVFNDYTARHGILSQDVLTVMDDETADTIAESLESRIAGKTVVEIGGGIGILALHMGLRAKKVFCIEANPIWASTFVACLLVAKPKNVSYLFGAADEFVGSIKADVAVFCTHSGVDSMIAAAKLFAPTVIDVYGEIIASNPTHFDALARKLRPFA